MILIAIIDIDMFSPDVAKVGATCICCHGTSSDGKILEKLGTDLTVALFRIHGVSTHPYVHRVCTGCRDVNLHQWSVATRAGVSAATMGALLDALRRVRDLNYHFLNDKSLVILSGLKKSAIQEVAALGKLDPVKVFRFFMYCRLGIGQRALGVLGSTTQSTISDLFNEVAETLEEPLASKYLRPSRDKIIEEHTPHLISVLLPHVRGATDGEYYYVDKSANFDFQKKTFSKVKSRNLVGAISFACPDGYWWDVLFVSFSDGRHNDEMKWEYVWQHNCQGVKSVLTDPDDSVLVDRYHFSFFLVVPASLLAPFPRDCLFVF